MTHAVAMVVGMPNVGKSSLMNLPLAHGKALRRHSPGKGAIEAGQQHVQVLHLCSFVSILISCPLPPKPDFGV